MNGYFYDHLLITEDIIVLLEKSGVGVNDRQKAYVIITETLHHHVIDVILTNLPRQHHDDFLSRFHKKPHDKSLLDFLKDKGLNDIENRITDSLASFKKKLIRDIKKTLSVR